MLTAAHCIAADPSGWEKFKAIYIFVPGPGQNPYSDADGVVELTQFGMADGAYGNPRFNGRTVVNDIAFITSPRPYTQFLMPVDIITDYGANMNTTAFVCGYGNTNDPTLEGKDSFFCLEGVVRPGAECIKLLDPSAEGRLDAGQVCELYKKGSACNGDSGRSPL